MGATIRVIAVTALAVLVGYLAQPFRPVVVRGHSMMPTFNDWQVAVAMPPKPNVNRGDIVVLEVDGATIIKRVALVAGDRIEEMFMPFAKTWAPMQTAASRRLAHRKHYRIRSTVIPEGMIWVLGDNINESTDSRKFGAVPVSSVKAVVLEA